MRPVRRVSWGAVFAGVVIVLAVQITLLLLGFAIGMSTIDPLEERNPLGGLGVGAAIWWVVATLIALFAGGWVSGRLAGYARQVTAALHGVLVWGFSTMVMLYVLTSTAGFAISGATNIIGGGLSMAGQAVGAAAPAVAGEVRARMSASGVTVDDLAAEVQTILRQTGKAELQPGNISQGAQTATTGQGSGTVTADIVARARNIRTAADREAVVNVLVARTDMTRPEAEATVDRWIRTYNELADQASQTSAAAAQRAREVADQAASAAAAGAAWAFVMLVLGAIAAAVGSTVGRPRDLAVDVVT